MSCTAIVARRHQVDCVVCVSGGRHHYRFQFLFCAVALATSLRVVLPALATAFHRAGCCILRRRGIATFRNAATPATFWMIPFSLRKAAQATPLSRGSFILFFYITMPLSGAPQLEISFSSLESRAADTPFWKFLCFFKSYHDALFRSAATPATFRNFPEFSSFSPPGSSAGCCMSHPQLSKSSFFLWKAAQRGCPYLEVLYFYFIITRC